MRWLTLHLELVTPCFLAGSENQGENKKDLEDAVREEGLRPASLIGQWRSLACALAWERHSASTGANARRFCSAASMTAGDKVVYGSGLATLCRL